MNDTIPRAGYCDYFELVPGDDAICKAGLSPWTFFQSVGMMERYIPCAPNALAWCCRRTTQAQRHGNC